MVRTLDMANVQSIRPPLPRDDVHPAELSPRLGVSPAFQDLINRLVQQHLVEVSMIDSVLLRQAELDASKAHPSTRSSRGDKHEHKHEPYNPDEKKIGFECSEEDDSKRMQTSNEALMKGVLAQCCGIGVQSLCARHECEDKIAKAKVEASQILDAFENDQQLFRNAEKMIDGEFDAEAAREFWIRWRTLSLFEKTKLWLQSSRYEMLQLDLCEKSQFLNSQTCPMPPRDLTAPR
eukprot:Skav208976  [mRNA]  locus=scaffold1039:30075:37578:+ [translate_table: standard]